MEWAGLPYFLAVARAGSLRGAAEALGASHATVDRHLRGLEAAYGVRLFDRTRGGLVLTQAGAALLPLAETAEATMIGARRRLQGLDREAAGLIRLSIPPGLAFDILAPILGRFSDAHPGIDLDLSITDRFQDLARAEADVSVRIAFNVDDDVVGRRVLQYHAAIYASRAYLDAHWATRGERGRGLAWIGWPGVDDAWVSDTPFPEARIRHRTNGAYMQLQACRAGMGLAILPVWVEAQFDGLVRVPGTAAWPDRSIWILLHSDLRRTTRVRLLVDHVVAELRRLRPAFEAAVRTSAAPAQRVSADLPTQRR